MADQHSPLPWRVGETYPRFIYPRFEVDGDNGSAIASCGHTSDPQAEGNAAFIVTACNQHASLIAQRDALLAAAKATDELVALWMDGVFRNLGVKWTCESNHPPAVLALRAAIKLAEGGQ